MKNQSFYLNLVARGILINAISYGMFLFVAKILVDGKHLLIGQEMKFTLPRVAAIALIAAIYFFIDINHQKVAKQKAAFGTFFFYINTTGIYCLLYGCLNSSVTSSVVGLACIASFIVLQKKNRKTFSEITIARGLILIIATIAIPIFIINWCMLGRVI
ncbi:MAG: hypothetical protein NT165_01940 [Candidatus Falkowbacteria bacterium]|nr:hypothetical protein [Candidatus Falkowbacteria bacterium]